MNRKTFAVISILSVVCGCITMTMQRKGFLDEFTFYGHRLGDVVTDSTRYGSMDVYPGVFSSYRPESCEFDVANANRLVKIRLGAKDCGRFVPRGIDPRVGTTDISRLRNHFEVAAKELYDNYGIRMVEGKGRDDDLIYDYSNGQFSVHFGFTGDNAYLKKGFYRSIMPYLTITLSGAKLPSCFEKNNPHFPGRSMQKSPPKGTEFFSFEGHTLGEELGCWNPVAFTNDMFGAGFIQFTQSLKRHGTIGGMQIFSGKNRIEDLKREFGRQAWSRFAVELARWVEIKYGIEFDPDPRQVHWGATLNPPRFRWENDEMSVAIGSSAVLYGDPRNPPNRERHLGTWLAVEEK